MISQALISLLPTALSAAFFSATHLAFARAMATWRTPELPPAPPVVSILKPVAGCDDGLLDNLATFAALDYPEYELLLGIASPDDPAVPVVRSFLAANPGLPARLVMTTPARGAILNPKVAQLVDLARAARGEVLVISDANVRVPQSYLRSLAATLAQPGVGLVSSVIAGAGARTIAAALDGAQLGASIAPSVVAAHALRLWPITVGKSMAMWRRDLEAAGGFAGVGDVLAEDDVLGQRFHALGRRVELCLDPIENHNADASWARTLDRHARWAMIRRSITPLGFGFELFLSPPIVAAIVAVIARTPLALGALAGALALSWIGALSSLTRLKSENALWLAALEPVRVTAMFLCWCAGWIRRRVAWRGNAFVLAAGSKLIPLDTGSGLARFATFARALIAGGAATVADLAVLSFAVGVLHVAPRVVNVPALLVGATIQFFANRRFAFRATTGSMRLQALAFAAAEVVTLVLNAALYHFVATRLPLTGTTAVLARLVTSNLVFVLWSYPVWTRVFRAAPAPSWSAA